MAAFVSWYSAAAAGRLGLDLWLDDSKGDVQKWPKWTLKLGIVKLDDLIGMATILSYYFWKRLKVAKTNGTCAAPDISRSKSFTLVILCRLKSLTQAVFNTRNVGMSSQIGDLKIFQIDYNLEVI